MSWLRLDDGFTEHPKVAGLSDKAFRLHVAALVYCARNLTDGYIEKGLETRLIRAKRGVPKRAINELVTCKLWDPQNGGFVIHDYLDYNPTAASVKAKRAADRERKRRREAAPIPRGIQAENTEIPRGIPRAPSQTQPKTYLPLTQALDVARRAGREKTPEQQNNYLARLITLCGPDDEARQKLKRAAQGKPEAVIVNAYEAATGPNVRDQLAVALAILGRHP